MGTGKWIPGLLVLTLLISACASSVFGKMGPAQPESENAFNPQDQGLSVPDSYSGAPPGNPPNAQPQPKPVPQQDSVNNDPPETFPVYQVMEYLPPEIVSLESEAGLIRVIAVDPNDDHISFSAEVLAGNLQLEGPFNEDGSSANFTIPDFNKPDSQILIRIIARDSSSLTAEGYCNGFSSLIVQPDSLYALAMTDRVSVGESIGVIVITGRLANPMAYLNACGISCKDGASYKPQTFDIGLPDDLPDSGAVFGIDGFWKNTGNKNFLIPPDSLIIGTPTSDGLIRTDFNITPLDGYQTQSAGALFSFEYVFSKPGLYTLGIVNSDDIPRSWYQDLDASEEFTWSNTDNDHVMNQVTVE